MEEAAWWAASKRFWRGSAEGRMKHDLKAIETMSLVELNAKLTSPEHYEATQTRNYGELDPLVGAGRLVFNCVCGGVAELVLEKPTERVQKKSRTIRTDPEGRSFFARCGACGRVGSPSIRDWRAVVDWNYENAKSWNREISEFPFFNLKGMGVVEARDRLESIRYDLTLRRAQAKRRRDAGEDVGGRFVAKLDAYLGWSHVGLRVLEQRK